MNLTRCPHCDAQIINRDAQRCWLCLEPLTGIQTASELIPFAEEVPERTLRQRTRRVREEAATDNPALALVAGLLLLLGIGLAQASALGVLLLMVVAVVPALVRLAYFTRKRATAGQRPLTGAENVLFFFTSLGVVVTIGIASFATFGLAFCTVMVGAMATTGRVGIYLPAWLPLVGLAIGAVPGLLLAWYLIRELGAKKV